MPGKSLQIYQCSTCETTIEVLEQCGLELICCGREMSPLLPRASGAGKSRHMPVVVPTCKGLKVCVGEQAHPMEPNHYIMWIELMAEGRSYRQFLAPGQPPEAEFETEAGSVVARVFCSVHGLWQARPTGKDLSFSAMPMGSGP